MKERNEKMKSSNKKGFTLIELVVVIAILAILALIMVPNLTAYLGKAKEAKIDANMKNIHTAAEMVRQTEGSLIEEKIKMFSNNEDVIVREADEDLEVDKYTVTNKGGQTVVKYKTQDGKVFTFPDVSNVNNGETGETGENEYIGEVYLAQDDDFEKINGRWVYRGSELEIEIPHIIKGEEITTYNYMFNGSGSYLATPVTRVDSNNKNVTSMYGMFYDSQAISLDLSSFNTSNVTDMWGMFYRSKATSLDLSSFDTSNVTRMSNMFRDSQATTLDLSSFDTSNVTNMYYMFYGSQATSLDLSNFDTSNVTNMRWMFRDSQATSLDLSNFDTSNVTDMWGMFWDSQATSLYLSSFNTSNVTSMWGMFNGSSATTLDLSSFDTSNVTSMNSMFKDSQATSGYARTQEDADKFNTSSNKPSGLTFVVK